MALSLAERFAVAPPALTREWLAALDAQRLDEIRRGAWWWTARPEQLHPSGDWFIWLYMAGRGCVAGETRVWLPLERRHAAISELAAAGQPVTVLALGPNGPQVARTDGAPFLKGYAELYEVVTPTTTVRVTAAHRFLTPAGWRRLADVRAGQLLAVGLPGQHGEASTGWERIVSVTSVGRAEFYDMTVPGPANYLAEGIWHHNSGKTRAGAEWLVDRVLKHPVDALGQRTEWLAIAQTLTDARSVMIEGVSGLLNVLRRRGLVEGRDFWYRKAPRLLVDFASGQRIYVDAADNADVGRGYNAAGAWCVAAGQLVLTDRGEVPIEGVGTSDRVWTRAGWRPVLGRVLTKRAAATVALGLSNGRELVCTPDHRVWVNGAWHQAREVVAGDTMAGWMTPPPAPPPGSTGPASAGTATDPIATTTSATARPCMSPSGSAPTGPSPRATTSTTSTMTGRTTDLSTWRALLPASTSRTTPASAPTHPGGPRRPPRPPAPAYGPTGCVGSPGPSPAISAAGSSSPPACGPSAVPMTAGASSAGTTLPVTVLSVRTGPDSDVYDIGVEGEHEFFASGVLVHNCDEICKWRYARASWLEGIMPSLRASLLGDHPRVFVSTTPKPIKLLIDWYKDKSGSVHLTTGSTFDNRANLSEQSIREMVNAYDGSSVGQQELYGKLLENVEGALWKRKQLDADRVRETPELVRVVVAVDPNITGTGDETGLIAAGRGDDGDHYILEDWSGMQTGHAAARRAWELFHHVEADWLVVEENQGKEWLLTVMRDAYFELQREGLFLPGGYPPLRPVHARAGKRLRAQPVASRHEQHRSHLVGSFVDLEDQLTTHDFATAKAGDSPDRLDAMVYAELELVGNESKGHISDEPAEGPLPGASDPYVANGLAPVMVGEGSPSAVAGTIWGGVDPYSFSR